MPFTLPQIGGYPKTLSAALHVVHTPIPDDDKGLIKVRLNGSLVSSERLSTNRATAPFTVTVTLPVDKLAQRNQLEVAFTYYPSQGNCAGVSPEMEATLFDDSSFLIGAPDIDKTLRLDSTVGQHAWARSSHHAQIYDHKSRIRHGMGGHVRRVAPGDA